MEKPKRGRNETHYNYDKYKNKEEDEGGELNPLGIRSKKIKGRNLRGDKLTPLQIRFKNNIIKGRNPRGKK